MIEKNEKRIIAISASPSKGRNSDTMLDYFISGISDFANQRILIEKVYLIDIPMDDYRYENKSGAGENEKELANLIEKIKNYDAIVISTPTYNFSVPARLKNLIDRIRPIALDLEKTNWLGQPIGQLKNKPMFFLVSGGTPNFVRFFLSFLFPGFWLKAVFGYYGTIRTKYIYCGDKEIFKKPKKLKKFYRLGRLFAKKILN